MTKNLYNTSVPEKRRIKMKMIRKSAAVFLAVILVVLTGCSSRMEMDPKSSAVEIDGIPANELVSMLGLDNTFEVSVDPDTGAVSIDGKSVNDIIKAKTAGKLQDQEEEGPSKSDGDRYRKDKESDDYTEEYEECGVTLTLPGRFKDILGVTESFGDEIGFCDDIYTVQYYYGGISSEWLSSLNERTEEDDEKIDSSIVDLPSVWCAKKGTDLSGITDTAEKSSYTLSEKYFKKICEKDGYVFYRYFDTDQKNYDNLDPDFRKEFSVLCDIMDEAIKNAEYYEPVNVYSDLIGKKLEFTTTDLDGNKVTSKELFADNEITMINVWATWCHNCLDELNELDRINKQLANKDCAVIGLLGDGTNDELIELGKSLLKKNDADYKNIVPWEGAIDDLAVTCWPMTYFVDRNGTILSKPILGARVKLYETAVDKLLKDPDTAAPAPDNTAAVPNDLKEYRIYVTDSDSDPVEGVMVQLCDDSTCRVANTDRDGLASFDTKKNDYEVHLLTVPKGFKENTDTYRLPDIYSDLHIVLEKK